MNPLAIVETCERAGVFLRLDNGKVKAYGRESVVAQFLPILKEHKEAIRAYLSEDEREFYEERAAIAEFDGGLSRPDAEAQAIQELQARRDKRKLH